MSETTKLSGNYWVEVSGWDLDSGFFVEKTDLYWGNGAGKQVALRHNVFKGAILFIRLLSHEADSAALPVPYRAAEIGAMNCNGISEISLQQLHPRQKVTQTGKLASYAQEDSRRNKNCEPKENSAQPEIEEVLQ